MHTLIPVMALTASLVAAPLANAQSGDAPGDDTPNAPEIEQGTTADEVAVIGMGVTSSDGIEVGTVSNVLTGEDGAIVALYVSVGALVGQIEWQIRIDAGEFTVAGDTVVLTIPQEDVISRPDVREHAGGLSAALTQPS